MGMLIAYLNNSGISLLQCKPLTQVAKNAKVMQYLEDAKYVKPGMLYLAPWFYYFTYV